MLLMEKATSYEYDKSDVWVTITQRLRFLSKMKYYALPKVTFYICEICDMLILQIVGL